MSLSHSRWAALGAAVAVTVGAGGICLVRAATPDSASAFVPITPCRVLDSRPEPEYNTGPRAIPLGAGQTETVAANSGACAGQIPATATGVSMNVTAVGATALSFLTIWAADAGRPNASSLNPAPGEPPAPNAVTTELSPDGKFSIYNLTGSVHVLGDINGYYIDLDAPAPKYFSLNVYSNPEINFSEAAFGSFADAGVGGLNIDVDYNFTVPPDHTPGTPMTIKVVAYTQTATTCNGSIERNWTYAARPAATSFNPNLTPSKIARVFTGADISHEYVFTLGSGGAALQPGDAVSFGLFSLDAAPRCFMVISGVSVHYT